MESTAKTLPESLGYLPGFFRAQIEPTDVAEHDFVRWVLQVFEANLHLSERMAENSRMLFDPDEVGLFAGKVAPPTLSIGDLADARSLASKLQGRSDKVSQFLWPHFQEILTDPGSFRSDSKRLQEAMVATLNKIIWHESLYDKERFTGVRFSEATRVLLRQHPSGGDLARLNRRLLEDTYPLEICPLPEASLLNLDGWELERLRSLASWIALDLDQAWISEALPESDREPRGGSKQHTIRLYPHARAIIKEAGSLYRQRGTPEGLKTLLRVFYDWDLDLIERAWPRGMQIGVSSSIGINSWLVDPPSLDHQFIVLIRSSELNRRRLPDLGQRIRSGLAGGLPGQEIEWLLGRGRTSSDSKASDQESEDSLLVVIRRLRDLLDREKPAHTRYYLALETSQGQPKPHALPYLVIEVHSEIGSFWIN